MRSLEKLLNNLIQKKALHEYGMSREQIEEFADSVIANQGRLMANNFVELDRDRLIKIYTEPVLIARKQSRLTMNPMKERK